MKKLDLLLELQQDFKEFVDLKGRTVKFDRWKLKEGKKKYYVMENGARKIRFCSDCCVVDNGSGMERRVLLTKDKTVMFCEDVEYGRGRIRVCVYYCMKENNVCIDDVDENLAKDIEKIEFSGMGADHSDELFGFSDLRFGTQVYQTDFGPRNWLSVEWEWGKNVGKEDELKLRFKKILGPEDKFFQKKGFSTVGFCGMIWHLFYGEENVEKSFEASFPGNISKEAVSKFLFEDYLFKVK